MVHSSKAPIKTLNPSLLFCLVGLKQQELEERLALGIKAYTHCMAIAKPFVWFLWCFKVGVSKLMTCVNVYSTVTVKKFICLIFRAAAYLSECDKVGDLNSNMPSHTVFKLLQSCHRLLPLFGGVISGWGSHSASAPSVWHLLVSLKTDVDLGQTFLSVQQFLGRTLKEMSAVGKNKGCVRKNLSQKNVLVLEVKTKNVFERLTWATDF